MQERIRASMVFLIGTLLVPVLGFAGSSDLMDARLGLDPLAFDLSRPDQQRGKLHNFTVSNAPDPQIDGGDAPPVTAAQTGDEGFESQDQSGNDPRQFASKFMPYFRYTKLKNDLEVKELTLFGFFAFDGRFGMTYELPIAKEIDYSDVDDFKKATENGCPPGSGSGGLPGVQPNPGGGGNLPFDDLECDGDNMGVGDLTLRFFLRPKSLEWSFGANKDKNFSLLPILEMTAPTATQDVLGGGAYILSPGAALVFDAPADMMPFKLGFFAMMNFYDFSAFRDDQRGPTKRYRGRWFWMQPLAKPTEEFTVFDLTGLYMMPELQPVYDFEAGHFSAWIAPEFGKIPQPGHVFYVKPGWAISPEADKGDRKFTFETGYRYFFD